MIQNGCRTNARQLLSVVNGDIGEGLALVRMLVAHTHEERVLFAAVRLLLDLTYPQTYINCSSTKQITQESLELFTDAHELVVANLLPSSSGPDDGLLATLVGPVEIQAIHP